MVTRLMRLFAAGVTVAALVACMPSPTTVRVPVEPAPVAKTHIQHWLTANGAKVYFVEATLEEWYQRMQMDLKALQTGRLPDAPSSEGDS